MNRSSRGKLAPWVSKRRLQVARSPRRPGCNPEFLLLGRPQLDGGADQSEAHEQGFELGAGVMAWAGDGRPRRWAMASEAPPRIQQGRGHHLIGFGP